MDRDRFSRLPTERRHAASRDLDRLPTEDIVGLLIEEDRRGIQAALKHRGKIATAAEWLAETLQAEGRAVFAGAGTSGRLAVLEAAECPPTFGTDPGRIQAVIAGGRKAVFEAQEGAEDRADDGRIAVGDIGSGDLVLAISASSVTPFALGALAEGRRRGARTVLLTCAAESDVLDPAGTPVAVDLVIALATGPEILTGSTRLKAGSATKAVLNALTTAAMVRAGKVFSHFMVDLRPGSRKLKDRSLRILQEAAGVSRGDAERLYEAADGHLKGALVMALLDVSADEAEERLGAAGGHVRGVLESAGVLGL